MLVGAFYYGRGQLSHLHRRMRAFKHDLLLHEALHFGGKSWGTLLPLLLRPSLLPGRYIEGAQARFIFKTAELSAASNRLKAGSTPISQAHRVSGG